MAVVAMKPGYMGDNRDAVEKFHGNQLLYVLWEDHRMFCAPFALPLPPSMSFGDFVTKVLPTTSYTAHPDWKEIDWDKVEWSYEGKPYQPDPKKSLADNGLVHKSFVRFRTPGLNGIAGTRT